MGVASRMHPLRRPSKFLDGRRISERLLACVFACATRRVGRSAQLRTLGGPRPSAGSDTTRDCSPLNVSVPMVGVLPGDPLRDRAGVVLQSVYQWALNSSWDGIRRAAWWTCWTARSEER